MRKWTSCCVLIPLVLLSLQSRNPSTYYGMICLLVTVMRRSNSCHTSRFQHQGKAVVPGYKLNIIIATSE